MKKNTSIINMTPHEVSYYENGKVVTTFPCEGLIRLSQNTVRTGSLDCKNVRVRLTRTEYGGSNLPPKKEETYYIVSSLVCQAYPDRDDFIIPNETVRDDGGRIIGCRSFSINPFWKGGDSHE